MKVIFTGNSNVGKTSIVNRIVSDKFYDKTEPTIGGAFSTVTLSNGVKYNIWDTAGQERYASLMPMYYRNADIGIYVYDITGVISNEFMEELQNKLFIMTYDAPECRIILVANKIDEMTDDEVSEKMGKINECLKQHNVTVNNHIALSAKSGVNINEFIDAIIGITVTVKSNKLSLLNLPDSQTTFYNVVPSCC